MKQIRNETEIKYAAELFKLVQERKDLEKRESELKMYFKTKYPTENALKLADIVVNLTEKERTNIDKTAIQLFLGIDKFKSFEVVSTYVQVDVRKA